MDIIDIVLSKKYTDESLKGITGTLAGKNCTIKSATKADGVTTVVFAWTADDGTEKTTTIQVNDGAKGDIGIGIDNMTINANSHLIVTLSDGSTIDAGLIQGGSGTDDYEDLINRPKIESVDLIGNKTFEDLGVASATDLAQTDGHLQDLADLVGDKANLPMPNETVVNNIEYVDTKVDSLIDDNVTGLTKTFSSDKIAKTFATLEEVNERLNDKVGNAWTHNTASDALSHALDGTPKMLICTVVYTISNIQHASSITIVIRGTETGSSRFIAGGAGVYVQLDINWDAKTYTTVEMYNGQTVPTNGVLWDWR